jgi:hypothetical protein
MPQTLIHSFGKNGVSIVDHEAISVIDWNGFAELLHGPLRRGMTGDIDMDQSTIGMLNDDKDIQNAKRYRDHHTKVTRHETFGVLADKRRPMLRVSALTRAAHTMVGHIFPDSPRRHANPEFEQKFVGNTLLALGQISHAMCRISACKSLGRAVCQAWISTAKRNGNLDDAIPQTLPVSRCAVLIASQTTGKAIPSRAESRWWRVSV